MAPGARVTVEGIALTAVLGGLQSLLREPSRLASFFLHGHPIHCARWLSSRTMVCVHFTHSPPPRPVASPLCRGVPHIVFE